MQRPSRAAERMTMSEKGVASLQLGTEAAARPLRAWGRAASEEQASLQAERVELKLMEVP